MRMKRGHAQESVNDGGMCAGAAEMLNQGPQTITCPGRAQLLEGGGELDRFRDVAWQRQPADTSLSMGKTSTHVESFFTISRKVSSTVMSGSSEPKRTRPPCGEGVRKPASACDSGRDLTRSGISRAQSPRSPKCEVKILQLMQGESKLSESWGAPNEKRRGGQEG